MKNNPLSATDPSGFFSMLDDAGLRAINIEHGLSIQQLNNMQFRFEQNSSTVGVLPTGNVQRTGPNNWNNAVGRSSGVNINLGGGLIAFNDEEMRYTVGGSGVHQSQRNAWAAIGETPTNERLANAAGRVGAGAYQGAAAVDSMMPHNARQVATSAVGAGFFYKAGKILEDIPFVKNFFSSKAGAGSVHTVSNFSRELRPEDLGVKGNLHELRGTYSVNDGVATMRVDMIRGEIRNSLEIVGGMMQTAKASGATTLRIEGTIANERLYNVLERRYGLTSSGANDLIILPLR